MATAGPLRRRRVVIAAASSAGEMLLRGFSPSRGAPATPPARRARCHRRRHRLLRDLRDARSHAMTPVTSERQSSSTNTNAKLRPSTGPSLQARWEAGGLSMYTAFNDLLFNKEANAELAEWCTRKSGVA
jgi:hypothetical protein